MNGELSLSEVEVVFADLDLRAGVALRRLIKTTGEVRIVARADGFHVKAGGAAKSRSVLLAAALEETYEALVVTRGGPGDG